MKPLNWLPERFPASGGLAADGFQKLLGRPRLDPLAVLTRETAQNSWDARDATNRPVQFAIEGWTLSDSEQRALRDLVFTRSDRVTGVDLDDVLHAPETTALFVSDRNTLGLGGPLRADVVDPSDTYDWVDFILNVGKSNVLDHTGGTYGFGKTICYVVSRVSAAVIHTRTIYQGKPQTRLIACAIGTDFKDRRALYTGRHWWGASSSGLPAPVVGRAADAIAEKIGMAPFEGDDLGTNIMVVDPDTGGRTLRQAMNYIAESVAWNLWPKIIDRSGHHAMDVTVLHDGEGVPVPRLEDRPPLHGFATALRILDGEISAEDSPVPVTRAELRSQRPRADLGALVMLPIVSKPRAAVDDGGDHEDPDGPEPAAMIRGAAHHVALLRTPELVVQYLDGPPLAESSLEWVGVFRCSNDEDRCFALAEPPTHDSWQPTLLPKGRAKTIVNVALREIRNSMANRWGLRAHVPSEAGGSTARVADSLAHLVRAVEGRGPGVVTPPSPGPGNRSERPTLEIESDLVEIDERAYTRVGVKVSPQRGSTGTRLSVSVGAALDGSTSDEDADPELRLVSASWGTTTVELDGTRADLELSSPTPISVALLVARSADTSVLVNASVEPLGLR